MEQNKFDEIIKQSNDCYRKTIAILNETWLVFPTEVDKLEFVKLTTPSQNDSCEEVE
jgi:hypothetical protein